MKIKYTGSSNILCGAIPLVQDQEFEVNDKFGFAILAKPNFERIYYSGGTVESKEDKNILANIDYVVPKELIKKIKEN